MNAFLSAKDILLQSDIFSQGRKTDSNGKKLPAHEFQDYAYRLASDLNDLIHLPIYMKLCKSTERHIIERAFSFVADTNSEKKGALFMWKLKKLKAELLKKQNLENFEHSYVVEVMKDVRNALQTKIFKEKETFNDWLMEFLANFQDAKKPSSKCLILGNSSILLPTILVNKGYKVFGLDYSNKLTTHLKQVFKNEKRCSFITKDFFKNSFKNQTFDSIIINKFWGFVPLEQENKYLSEIKRLLKPNGSLILEFKAGSKASQQWKEITVNGEEKSYLAKKNILEELKSRLQNLGYSISQVFSAETGYIVAINS